MPNETFATEQIPLTFRFNNRWRWLLYTFIGVILFHLATLMRPEYGELRQLLRGDIWGYLKYLLGYYVVFELISVAIFMWLAKWYLRKLGVTSLQASLGHLLRLELLFLPLILGSIFIFGPVTNGVRYLVVHFPDYSWAQYFPEYFFTGRMYANYLLPFLIFGYAFFNVNLFLDYNEWQKKRFEQLKSGMNEAGEQFLNTIEARDAEGETWLDTSNILWFEVDEKTYLAFTQGKTFEIRKTIAELEKELDPESFFRVNRSVIINLQYLKNYSFWENDKYVLRLSDDKTTFVMQRARLKELKKRLSPNAFPPES